MNLIPPSRLFTWLVNNLNFLSFDKEKYTVLRGLNWEIPFSVGGVNSDADFSMELSSGKDLVKELVQDCHEHLLRVKVQAVEWLR